MKNLYLTLLISLFICANIFNANSKTPIKLFIDPNAILDLSYTNGLTWETAFPTVESALQYTDVTNSDVIIYLKHGEHAPIKIHNTGMNEVKIYGGYVGPDFSTNTRDLDDPYARTIIRGTATQPAIWIEGMPTTSENVIDGLSLIGGSFSESLAIRVVGVSETIFSRCRIQDTNCPGNLIYLEGNNSTANSNYKVSFVNSVIFHNNVTNIVETFFNCCFVNSTVVNNSCTNFMRMEFPTNYNTYEVKNSIIKNTQCKSSGAPVKVYNSAVVNFRYFIDMENNTSGLNIGFTGEEDNPYEHIPNEYITARGNINFYNEYFEIIPQDNLDIIGNNRYIIDQDQIYIDLGAYQGSQVYSTSYVSENIQEENYYDEKNINSLNIANIYPTKLNSGEMLYLEHNLDIPVFVKIYNLNGVEIISQEIISKDNISLSLSTGIYIVAMQNAETQEIVCQKKIIVTN